MPFTFRRGTTIALVAAGSACVAQVVLASGEAACVALVGQNVYPNTTIVSARMQPPSPARKRPAFCEVTLSVKPVPHSDIKVVVRMPEGWNGKLLGSGGGGWAGNITLEAPGPNLPDGATPGLVGGYAVVQTNTGHEVGIARNPQTGRDAPNVWDTSWAVNPAAVVDFQYRAIHVMTDAGKAIIAKYYGRPHRRAYFEGCSTGGRQALMSVQRYPKDYDGVIAGAPVYTLATQTMSLVRNQALARAGAGLTPARLKKLNDAVLAKCDALDGLADGIVTDPLACAFDPAEVQCEVGSAGSDADCLLRNQVAALRELYGTIKDPTGATVSYPLMRGSELSWSRYISVEHVATEADYLNGAAGAGLGGLRSLVFGDASFNLAKFDAQKDFQVLRRSDFAKGYEARDPDISVFVNGGGKLLMWHGMYDPGPSVVATTEYYLEMKRVTAPKVKALDSSVRYFIAPGVYHCRGGPGADQFDLISVMDAWVERSEAPDRILATRRDGAFSRPLCPYPALPKYNGKGDAKLAESFVCD
jgi:feruloyl esterase